MYKNRLLKLAAFLRKVPSKHFDLESFNNFIDVEVGTFTLTEVAKTLKPLNCGTTACAIGWCPTVFPRNFKWIANNVYLRCNNGDIENGWNAGEIFFGLSKQEAYYLFEDIRYRVGHRGPKSVASRIEKFVKDGKISDKMYID